jgi:hypothetical protein
MQLGEAPQLADLAVASRRLGVARQVYNDAVRDTLALRQQRLPRALRLGAHHPLPRYFDIAEVQLALVSDVPAPPNRTIGIPGQ